VLAYLSVSISAASLTQLLLIKTLHQITSPNNTVSSTWRPKNGTSWQIVLLNPPTLPTTTYALPHFSVWDIDLLDNPSTTFSDIHNLGSKAICYFSAGTCEDWRPDAS
jgi:hypothetical protein